MLIALPPKKIYVKLLLICYGIDSSMISKDQQKEYLIAECVSAEIFILLVKDNHTFLIKIYKPTEGNV